MFARKKHTADGENIQAPNIWHIQNAVYSKVIINGSLNGEWIVANNVWSLCGGTGYMVRVALSCTFEELVDIILQKLNIDGCRNKLVLTVSFNDRVPPSPVTIDDGVETVIAGFATNKRTILAVNTVPKVVEGIGSSKGRGKAVIDEVDEADDDDPSDDYDTNEADEIGDVRPVIDSGKITRPGIRANVDHVLLADRRRIWRGRCILPPYVMEEINNIGSALQTDEIGEGICVGQTYSSKSALYNELSIDALSNHYQFITYKSEPTFVVYVCKEGKDKCQWRLRAKRTSPDSANMEVSKFKSVHTCVPRSIHSADHSQARASVLGELYIDKVMVSGGEFRARHIQADLKTLYGLNVRYQKAYRCREKALQMGQGTPEASYDLLPGYLTMLKKNNPNSICDLTLDDMGAFLYCYFCLGVSIQGFRSCRPLICVDATHLKNRYRGQLICAIALDADNHLYPLAFGIVDSENDDAYMYFMGWLKRSIGDIEDLVFISDRHPCIHKALLEVFPDAHHGICYYHLKGNVKKKYGDDKSCLVELRKAAYAYTKSMFWLHFNKIKVENKELAKDLEKIGHDRWSRAFFPGMRYAAITSNYCESFNSKLRDARKWTITALVEYIRSILQVWHYERLIEAEEMTKPLAPKMEERLQESIEHGRYLTCVPIIK